MKNKLLLLFLIITAVYCIGIKIPVMDVDAAQYASMSREMLQRGDFLHVYDQGKDYLDKPPFTFWICSASMAVFGINNFAYKLPSILFALLAIFCTYRLALLFYKKEIAVLSAIVLATCQALFLITQDCRTDTILMGWVILSIWQLAAYFEKRKLINFIIGSAAIGMGMLTKGPVALIVPVFAFGSHFMLRREWKQIIRAQYILALFIIALLLLPMCIGLYQQFDLHPEKIVNGQSGVSGLKFFFWTQSFGRITGASQWNNQTGIFFLLQNMLWAFLPWILFFLLGLFADIIHVIRNKFRLSGKEETISLGGFILAYFSLSLSHYQLPHYIFVVFPLAAIITGKCLYRLFTEKKFPTWRKVLAIVQYVGLSALLLGCWLIILFCFIPLHAGAYIYLAIASAGFVILFFYRLKYSRLIALSIYGIIIINIFLSNYFYPHLLKYEMGNVAGHWVQDKKIPANQFYVYQLQDTHSLSFYSQRTVPSLPEMSSLQNGWYILTNQHGLQQLQQTNHHIQIELTGEDYPVTRLSLPFLYYKTRASHLTPYYIVRIEAKS
jgi:4-amino-4-deoxy-L-arabinose transferase-like glycosyltransferase